MKAVVSVLMSVLNGEKTLDESISSILNQTFEDFEFIICDDASVDGTGRILESWRERDPRIVLIRNEKRMGLAASLNRCLALAKGAYIGRQDADDVSDPTRLEKTLAYLIENDLPYAGCGVRITDDGGVWSRRLYPEFITRHDIVKANPFFHPTLVLRREVMDGVGGYRVSEETSRTEDYDLIMRLAAKGIVGRNLQAYLYDVREPRGEYALKHRRATRLREFRTRLRGYRLMKVPLREYVYLLKPLALCAVPLGLLTRLKKFQWILKNRSNTRC